MSKNVFPRTIDSIDIISINIVDIESTTMDSNEIPTI